MNSHRFTIDIEVEEIRFLAEKSLNCLNTMILNLIDSKPYLNVRTDHPDSSERPAFLPFSANEMIKDNHSQSILGIIGNVWQCQPATGDLHWIPLVKEALNRLRKWSIYLVLVQNKLNHIRL